MKKGKPLILAIDDEVGVTNLIKNTVEDRLGWNIITANGGKEGLKTLKKHKTWVGIGPNKIDCVILDIKMPDLDGLDMLREWRKSEGFYEEMSVIILSAYEDQKKWAKATSPIVGGAVGYLKKPFNPDELVDVLEKVVIKKHGEYMKDDLREKSYVRRKELEDESK